MQDKMEKCCGNVKRAFSGSVYVRIVRNNLAVIGLLFLVSAFLVLLTYPGVIYSDSYTRINMAGDLEKWMHAFLRGNTELTDGKAWLTVAPSYFIGLARQTVGSISLYTFFQAFAFLFVSVMFGKQLIGVKKGWICILVVTVPVFSAYSVYYEAGVGCVTAIMSLCLLIWKWDDIDILPDKLLTVFLVLVLSFVAFGFRANAFTVLPVFLIVIFLNGRRWKKCTALFVPMILGLWFTSLLPRILNVDTMSSYAAGFLWETISVIQEMDGQKQEEYLTFVDDIFGEGVTKKALEVNVYDEQEASINPLLSVIPSDAISKENNPRRVLGKYVELMRLETGLFLRVKWKFISHTMGIHDPVNNYEYDYNRWDGMDVFGFNDSRQRAFFVDYFNAYMEYMRIFRMPWLLYAWALCLLVIWRVKFAARKETRGINLFETAFLMAVFYYGSYVLDTQSFEFRYFFPSWLMLFFVIVSLSVRMIGKIDAKHLNHTGIFAAALLSAVTIHGGMKTLDQSGDDMIGHVVANGALLSESDGQKVYLADGKLYFMADKSADTGYTYFLHYFTADGTMINNDFTYADAQMHAAKKNGKIAEKRIPLDDIVSIEYGQYYGDTRFWEYAVLLEDILEIPERVDVLEFTDGDWTNGYSSKENCFLAKEAALAYCLLSGKRLKACGNDGAAVRVVDVEEVNGYLRIYTDSVLDRSVERYEVID